MSIPFYPTSDPDAKGARENTSSSVANLVFAIAILALAVVGGKLFLDNLNANSSVAGEETNSSQEVTGPQAGLTIGEKVAKLMLVNQAELPTVATITNIDDLKADNPSFYASARNGDKLVVYSDKAIIYREESNLIINVLPVQRVDDQSNPN